MTPIILNAADYTAPLQADGRDVIIVVPPGTPHRRYVLRGDASGSITVVGGDGDAVRHGRGAGHASRHGRSRGNAARRDSGAGDAHRDGRGEGEAIRAGRGNGDAYRDGIGIGDALRLGTGTGSAYRTGGLANSGKAQRCLFGEGNAYTAHA